MHDNFYNELGKRIRALRKNGPNGKINQADLAEKASLTRASIANIESGRQRIMCHTLVDLSRALGVSPAELLCFLERTEENKVTPDSAIPENIGAAARAWITSFTSEN